MGKYIVLEGIDTTGKAPKSRYCVGDIKMLFLPKSLAVAILAQ